MGPPPYGSPYFKYAMHATRATFPSVSPPVLVWSLFLWKKAFYFHKVEKKKRFPRVKRER